MNERNYLLHSLIESASKVANITGTFGAFLKKFDKRSVKRMQFLKPEIKKGNPSEVYNNDSEELIKNIRGDILYIDPPYTNFNYSRGYHLLETIAKYDFPSIKGLTGVREESQPTSNFSKKRNALLSFENLIRKANFKHIIISYSNHGIIEENELLEMLSKFSKNKPIIETISYREYRTINKPKNKPLKEFLIYIEKDNNIVKSPLNYEGNKFKIIRNIINELPPKIDKFYDVFGGSGTVSMNILGANEIIYNDINNYSKSIVNFLIEENGFKIKKQINERISKFGLEKANKNSFYEFRK